MTVIAVPICSFCGATESSTSLLIAGPAALFICDGCVDLCTAVVAEHRRKGHRPDEAIDHTDRSADRLSALRSEILGEAVGD